jgi:hypothetical protein
VDRAVAVVALLLVAVIALPTMAAAVQAAIPSLLALLFLLGIARLLWPARRRRWR